MTFSTDRQTLFFAVYVHVGNKSPQRVREILAEFSQKLKREDPFNREQYEERYFVFPIKDGDTRMELLYPSPFLREEQAEALYEKYYERFQELTEKIEAL